MKKISYVVTFVVIVIVVIVFYKVLSNKSVPVPDDSPLPVVVETLTPIKDNRPWKE